MLSAAGEAAVTLSYRWLLPVLAAEKPGEEAALRRRRLGGLRLRFGRRRRLWQLVLRREHRTRHRSPLALGADRGVHLFPLRLVLHRPQGTPQRTRLLSYARGAVCFDVDSEPPIPRISGAAVSHDDLVLQSTDGNRFAAFRALPEGELTTGVVILPDVRGLYR
ncbi:MAG: hypothetical protein ACRDL7_01095, partial [Gaiellaceae bacterium]